MKAMVGTAAALTALVAPAAGMAQAVPGDVARNWSAITACGAIDDADKRHACVDGVMRDAGVLSEARVARNQREEFGRQREAQQPARAAPPARAAAAAPARTANIDQLVTTIKSVTTVGYRLLRVTTAEGSVWEQTQATQFNSEPQVGDGFAIERASLGSYMCRFGRAKNYRCKRVD